MKIYQMIYTSVKHSLSDSARGLSNGEGKRVYSCSEGLTRENINELVRFSNYKMIKASGIKYSPEPCDPSVPEQFPKSFRTLRLSDGRFAAIQAVYSGVDFEGERGNSYAHALIFDEYDGDFFPERYYNSPLFTTCLTKKQQENGMVRYLPEAEDLRDTKLDAEVEEFAKRHRKELLYLLEKAMALLTSSDIRNICIVTDNEKATAMYLLAIKYYLPRDIARHTGISTYNVYLPSENQFNIVFHGSVKGINNITANAIASKDSCLYIDMDNADFKTENPLPAADIPLDRLRRMYAECNFNSASAFYDWCDTYRYEKEQGVGARLIKLQRSGGNEVLRSRLCDIYDTTYKAHKEVSFEIAKILYDNSNMLPEREENISREFMRQCVNKMCGGEEYPLSDTCAQMSEIQAAAILGNLREYMGKIIAAYDNITKYNKKMLVEFFAVLKHRGIVDSWKKLFSGNADMLCAFVSMSAEQVITSAETEPFKLPRYWERPDLSELVAYIHSSTKDKTLIRDCLKYIMDNPKENWYSYGVKISRTKKSAKEEADDLSRVRRMLKSVGYLPFERGKYLNLHTSVRADINENLNPLLLSRVLDAYYTWRASAGRQAASKYDAQRVAELLGELREKEREVYDFVIPKLALEIIESPGHYHDRIINPQTMPQSFWNWFVIGYSRCTADDAVINYNRIYLSHREELLRCDAAKQIREAFHAVK